ncbi:MAG: branched-chain amino acid ABC transporter permease, partial [Dethiobacteria bacterium]
MIHDMMGRIYRNFKGEILVLPGRTLALLVGLAIFIAPLLTRDIYILRIITLTSIFAVFAASWDLLSGFVGQLNLGHALFFGVAAYTSAMLNLYLKLPPLLTIPLGAIAAVAAGLAIG